MNRNIFCHEFLASRGVEAGICGSRAELFSYLNDLPSSFEISLALSFWAWIFTSKKTRKTKHNSLRVYNHWSCFGCNLRIQWSSTSTCKSVQHCTALHSTAQHCTALLYCRAHSHNDWGSNLARTNRTSESCRNWAKACGSVKPYRALGQIQWLHTRKSFKEKKR